jgi:arginase
MSNHRKISCLAIFLMLIITTAMGSMPAEQDAKQEAKPGSLKVGVVLQPYTGSRSGSELSKGPDAMYLGLVSILSKMKLEEASKIVVKLTPDEDKEYGAWHRVGLANGHLGDIVAQSRKDGQFPLGLLGNCNSLLGMLAGLQHSGPTKRPLKVGLIWIDAHGDFNTPETTLSGMLGGMPVAVAAGKCLFRLRLKAGLDPAIPTKHIIMMGVRDLDPLEKELIDSSDITMVSTEDMKSLNQKMKTALKALSDRVDIIYAHIDLDVLDGSEIPGHGFLIPNGPTAKEMAEAFRLIMSYEKVGGIGVASFPMGYPKSFESTMTIIHGALTGLMERQNN